MAYRVSIRIKGLVLSVPVFIMVILATSSNGRSQRRPEFGSIPISLQASLSDRLSSFVAHQRQGEWDQVSGLLGDYYFALGWRRTKYNPKQKRWMVAQVRSNGILNFTAQRTIFSTDILSLPLSQKYWQIVGDGIFSRVGELVHVSAGFLAYRDKGLWFFVPLDVNEHGTGLVVPPAEPINRLQPTPE